MVMPSLAELSPHRRHPRACPEDLQRSINLAAHPRQPSQMLGTSPSMTSRWGWLCWWWSNRSRHPRP